MTKETDFPEETEKNRIEGIKTCIAEKVRDDSRNHVKLTSVDHLATLVIDPQPGEIEAHLADTLEDENYRDIKTLFNSTGAEYLYSEKYITSNYAEILARAEADDPVATIAATVREESRLFTRPTIIQLFKEQVFNINADDLETHITRVLEEEMFSDIKLIRTSTGVRYLFSNLYMKEEYARSFAEWDEVELYKNP